MRPAKKITLSAMAVALGVVFLVVGSAWQTLDLSLAALASLLVVFVYIEIGSPFTWLVWLATTLAAFMFFPGSIVWLEYFAVFGIYPILKAYIERLPRVLWLVVKLAYINAMLVAMIFAVRIILGMPFFAGDLWIVNAALYLVMNVAFVAYDLFLTVIIRLYMSKYRHRFRKFLK